jgi:hypothetical protein
MRKFDASFRMVCVQDWEKVHLQKESADQDELRAMYKLREQEIISQLMQLENKQYDMVSHHSPLIHIMKVYIP